MVSGSIVATTVIPWLAVTVAWLTLMYWLVITSSHTTSRRYGRWVRVTSTFIVSWILLSSVGWVTLSVLAAIH